MEKRKKKFMLLLFLINLMIQIFGGIYYDRTPAFVWALADAIILMVPLVFDLWYGLLFLLPVSVSELAWFFKLGTVGPLLHLTSFAVAVFLLGLAGEKLMTAQLSRRIVISSFLFEVSLLCEEVLYRVLFRLFLGRNITWKSVSGPFLSPANLLILAVLVVIILEDKNRASEKK